MKIVRRKKSESKRKPHDLSEAEQLKLRLQHLDQHIERDNYADDIICEETNAPYIRATEFKDILKGNLFKYKSSGALDFGIVMHEAFEKYMDAGIPTEFMLKTVAKALDADKKANVVSLVGENNAKATAVFSAFKKFVDTKGYTGLVRLVEPAFVVPLSLMKKRLKGKKFWGTPLLKFFVDNKISIKINPDFLICKEDGTLAIVDWKTTSRTALNDVRWDMQSFGQKFSLLYHAVGLEALGATVSQFDLLYLPKKGDNPNGRCVHLQASGPRVDTFAKYIEEYLSKCQDFQNKKKAYHSEDAVTFGVL